MKTDCLGPALAIDTSGSFCCVALRGRDGSIVNRESQGAGNHFEQIAALVAEVMALGTLRVSELDHIRIGIGPGSFTGLRIGMSFAKGLSVGAKVPLVGVSSSAGAAWAVVHKGGTGGILVVSDARREEVFLAEYVVRDGAIREIVAPCIEPVGYIQQWLLAHPQGKIVSPNQGFELPNGLLPVVESQVAVGLLLMEVGPIGSFSIDAVADLEPQYLRAVAAKTIEERSKP